ncbi:hypothetical protein [Paenibacillus taichungensis]
MTELIAMPLILIIVFASLVIIGIYYPGLSKRKKEIDTMKQARAIVDSKKPEDFTDNEKSTIKLACMMSAYRNEGVPNNYAQSIASRFRNIAATIDSGIIDESDISVIREYIVFKIYTFPYTKLNDTTV